MEYALRNVQAAVEATGGAIGDIVAVRIYVVNYRPTDAAVIAGALRAFFLDFDQKLLSTAIGVSNLVGAVAAPFFGRALDAWSVRRPLLASIALFAAATATMGLMPASVPMVFLLYGVSGLVGIGQDPTILATRPFSSGNT